MRFARLWRGCRRVRRRSAARGWTAGRRSPRCSYCLCCPCRPCHPTAIPRRRPCRRLRPCRNRSRGRPCHRRPATALKIRHRWRRRRRCRPGRVRRRRCRARWRGRPARPNRRPRCGGPGRRALCRRMIRRRCWQQTTWHYHRTSHRRTWLRGPRTWPTGAGP